MTASVSPLPVIPAETVDLAEAAVGGPIRWEANIYRMLATRPCSDPSGRSWLTFLSTAP